MLPRSSLSRIQGYPQGELHWQDRERDRQTDRQERQTDRQRDQAGDVQQSLANIYFFTVAFIF